MDGGGWAWMVDETWEFNQFVFGDRTKLMEYVFGMI